MSRFLDFLRVSVLGFILIGLLGNLVYVICTTSRFFRQVCASAHSHPTYSMLNTSHMSSIKLFEWNANSQWKWRLIISCVNPTKRRKLMMVRWKAAKIWSMQHFWKPMINAKGWYLHRVLWNVIHDTLLPTDSLIMFYSNDRYIESHQFCRDKVRKGCEQYQNNVYGCINMVLVDHFSRLVRVVMYCCYYYFLSFLLVSTICEHFPCVMNLTILYCCAWNNLVFQLYN